MQKYVKLEYMLFGFVYGTGISNSMSMVKDLLAFQQTTIVLLLKITSVLMVGFFDIYLYIAIYLFYLLKLEYI